MSPWASWSPEPFARAKAQRRPLLAALGPRPPRALESAAAEIELAFVAVLADPETRPDAALRIGSGNAVVMDPEGVRRAVLPLSLPDIVVALRRLAREAVAPPRPEVFASARAGAARGKVLRELPGPDQISAVFAELVRRPPAGEPAIAEALLHAAGERGDSAAAAALEGVLEARLSEWDDELRAFRSDSNSLLAGHARWAALFWDAHALTGEPRWLRAAAAATDVLLSRLFDPVAGAFRRAPAPEPAVYPAEGNAQAALALLRARAFGHAGAGSAADKALAFLQTRLYDPLLGLLHARGGDGEAVCGLLGDAAWVALAFTEGFLASGIKVQREFADALLRFLFQELWEREAGGFLDRVPRADDPPILREPCVDPELNAVALELCRRLFHLKGNHNYGRWLEWGLRGAWPGDGARRAAGLARLADLHARGRLDLELVGRPGEAKADALLDAVHRLYLPRKVISFVDPDDQDYILAHRLQAESYPRLFACGADLRPLAEACDPAGVPGLIEVAAARP